MNIKKSRLVLIILMGLMLLHTPAESRFLFFGRKKTETEKKVDVQLNNFKSKKPAQRIRAVRNLKKLGGENVREHLIEKLQSEKDSGVRAEIAENIASMKGKDVADALKSQISREEDSRSRTVEVLALGINAAPGSVEFLGNIFLDTGEDIDVRLQAGNGLSYGDSKKALEIFTLALEDENERIRKQALIGIHNINAPYEKKMEVFREALRDESNQVSGFARELMDIYLKGRR